MPKTTLNETMKRLLLLTEAGYPVIYIVSHEEGRVADFLCKMFRVISTRNDQLNRPAKQFLKWYEGRQVERFNGPLTTNQPISDDGDWPWLEIEDSPAASDPRWTNKGGNNAGAVLKTIATADRNDPDFGNCVAIFFDLHPYLRENAALSTGQSLVRPLRNAAEQLRGYYETNSGRDYKTLVVVSPSPLGLSLELVRDIVVLEFPLPDTDELRKTQDRMVTGGVLTYAVAGETESLKDLIAGAGRGLALTDYKLGLNQFMVRREGIHEKHVDDLLRLKAKVIGDNKALSYYPNVKIKLGGLNNILSWVRKRRQAAASESFRRQYALPPLRGVLLCGVAGGGKSQLAKLIADEFNLALLRLDVGALFGSYVGESEENTRQALRLAEVLSPIVLWIDEIDKMMVAGGQGDNGVSQRVLGFFLQWMSEKEDNIFVVATANDPQKLLDKHPEFGRKGRFDQIFWVGLPSHPARVQIFMQYLMPLQDRIIISNLDKLANENGVPIAAIQGQNDLERLAFLLGHPTISDKMTGAEIEYAIVDAQYETVAADESLSDAAFLIAVKKGRDDAIYRQGGSHYDNFVLLQAFVNNQGWPAAG